MMYHKIFNLLCIGLILSISIVEVKGKIAKGSKTGSSKPSGSSSSVTTTSHRRTTSQPIIKHTTSSYRTTPRPIIKQTVRPVEASRYPTQPPYNPNYVPPQPHYPNYPQPQPHYPQPHYPQPHYPQQQPHYPQPHYPQPHYPQQQYPQQYYPQPVNTNWGSNKPPKKSNVGRNIATHAIAGLGGAYVGHQIGKHSTWYEKKQRERQQERERTHTTTKNRTNTYGLDRLKPITPFKVHDISTDPDAMRHDTGNGLKMINDVHSRYNNDPQKNEITKAAEANMYLNMKLRPSKSETVPKKNYTTDQLQGMIMSGGTMAMIGGALGALGGAGPMGVGQPTFGAQPNTVSQPGGVELVADTQPSVAGQNSSISVAINPNSTIPSVPQVPVIQPPQQNQTTQSNFTITGGQSILQPNQAQTPYKIPLTDPQVLPLVLKQLESDEKLDKKSFKTNTGTGSIYTISNSLIIISFVVIQKFFN